MPPRRKAARAATRTRAMRGARTRARRESLSGRNHPRARRMSSPSIPRTLRTGRTTPPTRRTTRVSGPNRRQRYRRRRRARNGLTVSHRSQILSVSRVRPIRAHTPESARTERAPSRKVTSDALCSYTCSTSASQVRCILLFTCDRLHAILFTVRVRRSVTTWTRI